MNTILGILLHLHLIASPSTITVTAINTQVENHRPVIETLMRDPNLMGQIMHDYQGQINGIVVIDDSAME